MRSIIIGKVERSAIDTGANAFLVNGFLSIGYNVVYFKMSCSKMIFFPIKKKYMLWSYYTFSPLSRTFDHLFFQIFNTFSSKFTD